MKADINWGRRWKSEFQYCSWILLLSCPPFFNPTSFQIHFTQRLCFLSWHKIFSPVMCELCLILQRQGEKRVRGCPPSLPLILVLLHLSNCSQDEGGTRAGFEIRVLFCLREVVSPWNLYPNFVPTTKDGRRRRRVKYISLGENPSRERRDLLLNWHRAIAHPSCRRRRRFLFSTRPTTTTTTTTKVQYTGYIRRATQGSHPNFVSIILVLSCFCLVCALVFFEEEEEEATLLFVSLASLKDSKLFMIPKIALYPFLHMARQICVKERKGRISEWVCVRLTAWVRSRGGRHKGERWLAGWVKREEEILYERWVISTSWTYSNRENCQRLSFLMTWWISRGCGKGTLFIRWCHSHPCVGCVVSLARMAVRYRCWGGGGKQS